MDTIFKNSDHNPSGSIGVGADEDMDSYVYSIRALIEDAEDYERSELAASREELQEYYNGDSPRLGGDDEYGEDEDFQQSDAVSTDIRDTVLAIMPTLMRTFAASEHAVNFLPRNSREVQIARQQTDYIRYKFWDENQGFMVLHDAIKDCLTVRLGVVTWWSDTSTEVQEKTFTNISLETLALVIEQSASMEPSITEMGDPDEMGVVPYAVVRYFKSVPSLKVAAVPPEEFRISRRAKSVQKADCVGWERLERASEVISRGFDPELVKQYIGEAETYSYEADLRNPGVGTSNPLNDYVVFGEYFIRVDEDGDGINELHKITTIGANHDIIDDYIAPRANFALFQSDPRPHTAIGDCPASLVKEIQSIKTSILRDSLDSLKETLNPRTAINEMTTNVEDATAPGRGGVIRTRGNPSESVFPLVTPFVGAQGIDMLGYFDGVRQNRTGITEQSKGMDPKVFQSTNEQAIDFVVNGAQERIELIARIIAETGLRDLYIGMLGEVVDNPNEEEEIMVNGKFVAVQPTLFDDGMRCVVNPTLGKGSDVIRLQALEKVFAMQENAIAKFGVGNGVVGIPEMLNTIEDMLALINIKDTTRYFRKVDPETLKAIEQAPREPDPAELLAKAEMEKVKKDLVNTKAKLDLQEMGMQMDDDFRRDKLNVESYLHLVDSIADLITVKSEHEHVGNMNEPI